MKRFLLLLLSTLLLSPTLKAEEPQQEPIVPYEEDILKHTLSTSSPYYYTNLMLKYKLGTEAMSDMEYYYLYYGFAYQESYRPFADNKALDEMMNVMSGINPSNPTVAQLEALVELGVESMEIDPFNPKVLNLMAYAYGALDDTHREQQYFNHLNGILRAIEMSGTGLKEESPWHILMFSHAYDLVASNGYAYNEGKVLSRTTVFVPLIRKSGNKTKGYYFDYSRIYMNKPEGYTFKRDRTWQFNNLKPQEYK